jgi:hypothetical protein
MAKTYRVEALWDEAAQVWVATSEDVPGRVSEAKSLDELHVRVMAVAPELLAKNGIAAQAGDMDFHIVSQLNLDAAE